MENNKKLSVIEISGENVELRSIKPLSDNSINIVVNIREQEDEVMGLLYGMKKRGLKYAVFSDTDIGDIEEESNDDNHSIH